MIADSTVYTLIFIVIVNLFVHIEPDIDFLTTQYCSFHVYSRGGQKRPVWLRWSTVLFALVTSCIFQVVPNTFIVGLIWVYLYKLASSMLTYSRLFFLLCYVFYLLIFCSSVFAVYLVVWVSFLCYCCITTVLPWLLLCYYHVTGL